MRRLLLGISLIISTNVYPDVVRLACSSDKVFSIFRVGDTTEIHKEVNLLATIMSINLPKSEIKISWSNRTHNTTGDINMKIIDVRNEGKIILGFRADSEYELHQFDLENLQTSWTTIKPTVDMYMLSKCTKSN